MKFGNEEKSFAAGAAAAAWLTETTRRGRPRYRVWWRVESGRREPCWLRAAHCLRSNPPPWQSGQPEYSRHWCRSMRLRQGPGQALSEVLMGLAGEGGGWN